MKTTNWSSFLSNTKRIWKSGTTRVGALYTPLRALVIWMSPSKFDLSRNFSKNLLKIERKIPRRNRSPTPVARSGTRRRFSCKNTSKQTTYVCVFTVANLISKMYKFLIVTFHTGRICKFRKSFTSSRVTKHMESHF